MPCHIYPLKIIQKTLENIYYNTLKVINGEFSQHASMPRHLCQLKIILKNLENYIFTN
jgi:hypothetical protein